MSRRGTWSSTDVAEHGSGSPLILDPSLALVCLAHFAPPINDSFRKSYRVLLRWNDELPFAKFSVGEDERPLLMVEVPVAQAGRDALGLALARELAIADRFHAEATTWLKAGGWPVDPPAPAEVDGPGVRLIARYAAELAELLEPPRRRPTRDPPAVRPRSRSPLVAHGRSAPALAAPAAPRGRPRPRRAAPPPT